MEQPSLKTIGSVTTQVRSDYSAQVSLFSLPVPVLKAEAILQHFDFIEPIGKGSFGTVLKARRLSDNEIVAVKVLPKGSLAVREVATLARLDHQNVVRLLQVYIGDDVLFLVQEYCELKFADVTRCLRDDQMLEVMVQVITALDYIHSKGVVHRDIKPDNIMFTRSHDGRLTLKIIDFGLAAPEDGPEPLRAPAGTNYYLAPEVITNDYNRKADLWSVGMLLLVMVNKEVPFRSTSQRQVFQEILAFDAESVKFSSSTPIWLSTLARKLLEPDYNQRPDAREILDSGLTQVLRICNKSS